MKHTLMRLLVATAVVCGLAHQAWAQAATTALPALPDLTPLYNPVAIDSVATHRSWASGRGIYAFFASDAAQAVLRRAGLSVGDDGLVYIGQTKNTFRQRLTNHFTGTSNLRSSLRSILSHTGSTASRADVSGFMRSNLRVAMLSLDDAVVIDTVEARLIRTSSPPLNTAGVSNTNTRRLKQLRKVLATTSTTSTGTVVSTLAKGTGIGVLLELPVTAAVEYLHVRNGRKPPEEAALDGARTVGTTAVVGAVAAGAFSAAATAGITMSAPVVMPVAVVGGGLYLWVSGDRIWDALHEDTRTAVEARFAAAAAAVGWNDSETADGRP
ncbi:MAG: GIY-YIG nuclease family protein [Acidobacteria bacterium]|nr:GIY-YIG nuclease family protein [Acidobacteriota bacterium]